MNIYKAANVFYKLAMYDIATYKGILEEILSKINSIEEYKKAYNDNTTRKSEYFREKPYYELKRKLSPYCFEFSQIIDKLLEEHEMETFYVESKKWFDDTGKFLADKLDFLKREKVWEIIDKILKVARDVYEHLNAYYITIFDADVWENLDIEKQKQQKQREYEEHQRRYNEFMEQQKAMPSVAELEEAVRNARLALKKTIAGGNKSHIAKREKDLEQATHILNQKQQYEKFMLKEKEELEKIKQELVTYKAAFVK